MNSRNVTGKPATFVLLHGAWHGGWCWKNLSPLLRREGHEVFTPTLTGLGERSHLTHPDVDLNTHIADVLAVLEYQDRTDVILVGHSYGGMVVTGVADQARHKISQLVYIDALLPDDDKAVTDYGNPLPTRDDSWRIPCPFTPQQFGVTGEQDIAWIERLTVDQPIKTFTQPIRLTGKCLEPGRCAFIQTSESPVFVDSAARAASRGYRCYELVAAGHDAMITQPHALAEILLELADGM